MGSNIFSSNKIVVSLNKCSYSKLFSFYLTYHSNQKILFLSVIFTTICYKSSISASIPSWERSIILIIYFLSIQAIGVIEIYSFLIVLKELHKIQLRFSLPLFLVFLVMEVQITFITRWKREWLFHYYYYFVYLTVL